MKAVIFDFDGTLVDSLVGVIKVYERVRGGTPLTSAQRRALQNKSLLQIALDMGVPKWKILFLAVWGRRMFHKHLRSVQVHTGIPDLLAELHKKGVPLYVLSANRTANVRKYLQWHDLDKYFVGVYGGASFLSKTRAMTKLLRQEQLTAGKVLCVGDERVDIRSAHAAGLQVAAVTWGYSNEQRLAALRPEYLVHTSEGLKKVVHAWLKKLS